MSYKEGFDEYLIMVRPYFFTEVFTESIKNVDMTKIKKIIQRNPKLDYNTRLQLIGFTKVVIYSRKLEATTLGI